MKYTYKTESGMKGHVEADTEQLAVVMLSEQYGPEGATLIEGGKQPAAAAEAPAPTADTREPAVAAGDPHGWSRAFAAAGRRG